MNKAMLNEFQIITEEDSPVSLGITTAENNINFKFDTKEGQDNLSKLKENLGAKEIYYLKQVHSDKIVTLEEGVVLNGQIEGDAIITGCRNTIIGVFTADCVPVLMWDKSSGVIAAVHSGWKGTINNIVLKTTEIMIKDFNCKSENIKVYIGPHIRECCYEVSEELINNFKKEEIYSNNIINNERYLSLEKCIGIQLQKIGITTQNILKSNLCTLCEKEIKLHSYRKDSESSGRMFSYIYIK